MIERKMLIGLITSTEYLQQIRSVWNPLLLDATIGRRVSHWCWEYYDKYNRAPGKDFESLFFAKLKDGKIPEDIAEELELSILPSISKEYESEGVNLQYLVEETQKFFKEKSLEKFADDIQALLKAGELLEAEKMACEYKPLMKGTDIGLDFTSEVLIDRVEKAFGTTDQAIIKYPGQLGDFWNSQLTKGGFVALMGTEKRGKTFWLLDLALRASKQGNKVAFFQAGDMTEDQQLMRICVYTAMKSNISKYCEKHWTPVRDCIKNQRNECDRKERSCSFGVFEGETEKYVREEVDLEDLISAFNDNKDYKPCSNCEDYRHRKWGAVWIKEIEKVDPLTVEEAKKIMGDWFINNGRKFKLSSHANDTLSIKQIKALLSIWEKEDDFIPDVIVIDYADLLVPENKDFRHGQNEIWKGLRALSQSGGNPLVITATQADAKAYDQDRLKMKNFSEDKRKYAHVTALWGLNQNKSGRDKRIGIMILNEIVIREGQFSHTNEITVLQDLWRGRPFLGSFW